MSNKFNSKSELSKARNSGAAHEGTHHWLMQRATAIALVPLTIWFVFSIVSLLGSGAYQASLFFTSPLNAILMALIIIVSFYHSALGLQTVIEDYVHCGLKKTVSLLIVKFGLFALAAVSLLAIVKLHLA
jgi:succinate dehydrogenase / fumarate reductase membrane anchor subunit